MQKRVLLVHLWLRLLKSGLRIMAFATVELGCRQLHGCQEIRLQFLHAVTVNNWWFKYMTWNSSECNSWIFGHFVTLTSLLSLLAWTCADAPSSCSRVRGPSPLIQSYRPPFILLTVRRAGRSRSGVLLGRVTEHWVRKPWFETRKWLMKCTGVGYPRWSKVWSGSRSEYPHTCGSTRPHRNTRESWMSMQMVELARWRARWC